MFFKLDVLRNFITSPGKTPGLKSLFKKIAGLVAAFVNVGKREVEG